MHRIDFMLAINESFGRGGMFCTLSDVELGNHLLLKVKDFMNSKSPRVLKAVQNVGQQDVHPPIFLLSPEVI